MYKDLVDDLSRVFESSQYAANKADVIKKIKERKRLSLVELKQIESHPDKVMMFDDKFLNKIKIYLLVTILSETVSEKIDVHKYFHNDEIKQFENTLKQSEERVSINVSDVRMLALNQYSLVLSIREIVALYKSNIIRLDNSLPGNKSKSGSVARIYSNKVSEICKQILSNKYYYDELRFVTPNVEYDKSTKNLSITNQCTVVEGRHRIMACIDLAELQDVDESILNNCFSVTLVVMQQNEIIDMMRQLWNTRSSRIALVENGSSISRRIVDYIVNENNGLNEKMRSNFSETMESGCEFIISDFAKMIDRYYPECKENDIQNIGGWIVKFMNTISLLYPDEFDNISERFKTTTMFCRIVAIWMIYLSKRIYDDSLLKDGSEWIDILKETLNIDWNIKSGVLYRYVYSLSTVSDTTCSQVEKFFGARYESAKKI